VNDGTDYTLLLGGTYYGGSIDLATGVMTVTWYGVTLTEETPIFFSTLRTGGIFEVQYSNSNLPEGYIYKTQTCSHLIYDSSYNVTYEHFYMGKRLYMWLDCQTKEEYLTWLTSQKNAGTPVTVAYQLVTPLTVQLTPTSISALAQTDKYTPRLNTIYSDQQAVQVGYVKSPIREEFELQQAIVGQGGNI
jgi:hypothetical protein